MLDAPDGREPFKVPTDVEGRAGPAGMGARRRDGGQGVGQSVGLALARRQGDQREGLAGSGAPGGAPALRAGRGWGYARPPRTPPRGGARVKVAADPSERGAGCGPCEKTRRRRRGVGGSEVVATGRGGWHYAPPPWPLSGSRVAQHLLHERRLVRASGSRVEVAEHGAVEQTPAGPTSSTWPPGGNPQGAQATGGAAGQPSEARAAAWPSGTTRATGPTAVPEPFPVGARSGPNCGGWCGPNGPRRAAMNEAKRAGVGAPRGAPNWRHNWAPTAVGWVRWVGRRVASWVLTLSKIVARVGGGALSNHPHREPPFRR